MTATAAAPTKLYWNDRGRVACDRHAPMRGSDTWKWEHWRKAPVPDLHCGTCR